MMVSTLFKLLRQLTWILTAVTLGLGFVFMFLSENKTEKKVVKSKPLQEVKSRKPRPQRRSRRKRR